MIHKVSVEYKSIHGLEAKLIFDAKDKAEARKSFEKFLDMTELHEFQYAGQSLFNRASDTISSIQINNLIWDTNSTFNIETLQSSGWQEAPDIMMLGDTVGVTVA
jgi:transposase-like protein